MGKGIETILGLVGIILGLLFLIGAAMADTFEEEMLALGWSAVMYILGYSNLILARQRE